MYNIICMLFHLWNYIRILFIKDILETKVLGSNKIYTHHWKSGDILVLNNPSLAHVAGPGSQGSLEATGLRLMHRSTVPGRIPPTKQTSVEYFCYQHEPFPEGYCLFSLKVSFYIKLNYVKWHLLIFFNIFKIWPQH